MYSRIAFQAVPLFIILIQARPLPALPPTAQLAEDEAVAAVQRMPASELEDTLPSQPFESWLSETAGDGADIQWELNDCGEQTGDPDIDAGRVIPVCVSAYVALADGREFSVSILAGTWPGTWEDWLETPFVLHGLYWFLGDRFKPIERLSDLPELIRSGPPDEPGELDEPHAEDAVEPSQ